MMGSCLPVFEGEFAHWRDARPAVCAGLGIYN